MDILTAAAQPAISCAATVASLSGIPLLPDAINLINEIITRCDNVSAIQGSVKELQLKCRDLLRILNNVDQNKEDIEVRDYTVVLLRVLRKIQDDLQEWESYNFFKLFIYQRRVKDKTTQAYSELSRYVECFSLASQNDIRKNVHLMAEELVKNRDSRPGVHFADSPVKETFIRQIFKKLTEMMLTQNLPNVQMNSNIPLPKGGKIKAGKVHRTGTQPILGNMDVDVWRGTYMNTVECTLKVVRCSKFSEKQRKRLIREVKIWRDLYSVDKGKYIVPFFGYCFIDSQIPYLVGPYYKNGDALAYLRNNPDVNRLCMIRRIAEGLKLLHSWKPPIAHGELKAAKIMIGDDGYPLIADFGLSKIVENIQGVPFTRSMVNSEQHRWFAPEVYSSSYTVSTEADVFSYAMMVLEIMTAEVPFADFKGPKVGEIARMVQDGLRPTRPASQIVIERGLDDKLWGLLEQCWDQEPRNRPAIVEVCEKLPRPADADN